MFTYSVFGGTLRSELAFPELSPADSLPPRWVIHTSRASVASSGREFLGEDHVDGSTRVRLWQAEAGLQLTYDDTGTFTIGRDGKEITWSPGDDPNPEAVRLDILGRVLPLALHLQGKFCLHASAVTVAGRALGFVAPQFHGKSTLAQALVAAGGELLTDDVLPVGIEGTVVALPGVQRVRLWPDCARLMGAGATDSESKLYLQPPAGQLASRALPLEAIYRLNPVSEGETIEPLQRTKLPEIHAALELIRHSKLGCLLEKFGASDVLNQAGTVAAGVPVYRLDIVRKLERLPEVVERLQAWHDPSIGHAVSRSLVSG
jgi:hypothetical protein